MDGQTSTAKDRVRQYLGWRRRPVHQKKSQIVRRSIWQGLFFGFWMTVWFAIFWGFSWYLVVQAPLVALMFGLLMMWTALGQQRAAFGGPLPEDEVAT
jgi:hypothetical protein